MAEYKVTKVSDKVRTWNGPNGAIYYHKVMLEGHDRPVSIGKKTPNSITVGQTVTGDITDDPKFDEDKFKATSTQSQDRQFKGDPDTRNSIEWQTALKAATETVRDFWGFKVVSSSMTLEDYRNQVIDTASVYAKTVQDKPEVSQVREFSDEEAEEVVVDDIPF
jgi:hypothetical protein